MQKSVLMGYIEWGRVNIWVQKLRNAEKSFNVYPNTHLLLYTGKF